MIIVQPWWHSLSFPFILLRVTTKFFTLIISLFWHSVFWSSSQLHFVQSKSCQERMDQMTSFSFAVSRKQHSKLEGGVIFLPATRFTFSVSPCLPSNHLHVHFPFIHEYSLASSSFPPSWQLHLQHPFPSTAYPLRPLGVQYTLTILPCPSNIFTTPQYLETRYGFECFTCQSGPRKNSTGSPSVCRWGRAPEPACATKGVRTLSVVCWYCSMQPLPFRISSSSSLSHVVLRKAEKWKKVKIHFQYVSFNFFYPKF